MFGFYEKGTAHKVCQDYVLVNDKFSIWSDGCSSVPFSDYGARVLTHSLANEIESLQFFGKDSIIQAFSDSIKNSISIFNGPLENLSATLGLIYKHSDNDYYLALQGDGYFFYKINESLYLFEINCSQTINDRVISLPSYPYTIYSEEKNSYLEVAPYKTLNMYKDGKLYFSQKYPSDELVYFPLHGIELDVVGGCSDGLSTFSDFSQVEVLNGLFSGNMHGDFIPRMYKNYLLKTQCLSHFDDFSVVYDNTL